MIAQNVQSVLPEIVNTFANDTYLNVAYDGLIPLLTEAIKELEVLYGNIYMDRKLMMDDGKMNDNHHHHYTHHEEVSISDIESNISALTREEEQLLELHEGLMKQIDSLEDGIKRLCAYHHNNSNRTRTLSTSVSEQ